MDLEFEGRRYELLRGSDVERNGMYLELNDVTDPTTVTVLFAFYCDADGRMTFSAYRDEVPLEAVELFVRAAREALPPRPQPHR